MTAMDSWSDALKDVATHEERLLQQKISIVNKDIKESDYIVIDIEFSVSNAEDCPFKSQDEKYQTHPRFDIIAIQPKKNYRLAIIELKRDGLVSSPVLEMLRQLHIHPHGFSKYCMGAAMTNSTLRVNRFKEKLLYVDKILQSEN